MIAGGPTDTISKAKAGRMAQATRSLREVFAAGVRNGRKQRDLRQDDAAARLRAHGLTSWLRGTVAQAETGARRFSLEDLVLLALAYETTLADLVAGDDDDWIELSSEARVSVGALRTLLSGGQVAIHSDHPQVDIPATRGVAAPARASRFPDLLADARRLGVDRPLDADRALAGIGEAERHAARKIGTSPERINLAALALWGRTLAEERDYRVAGQTEPERPSPRALQALRGHVTRELVTELQPELKRSGLL